VSKWLPQSSCHPASFWCVTFLAPLGCWLAGLLVVAPTGQYFQLRRKSRTSYRRAFSSHANLASSHSPSHLDRQQCIYLRTCIGLAFLCAISIYLPTGLSCLGGDLLIWYHHSRHHLGVPRPNHPTVPFLDLDVNLDVRLPTSPRSRHRRTTRVCLDLRMVGSHISTHSWLSSWVCCRSWESTEVRTSSISASSRRKHSIPS
jgi:hypothetical protein